MEPLYRSVIGLGHVLFTYQGLRFTVTGSENIPRTGGAVMVINHTGYMDFTYAGTPHCRLVAWCGSWPRRACSATRSAAR